MVEKEDEEKKALLKFSPELFEILAKMHEIELEDVDLDVGASAASVGASVGFAFQSSTTG